MAIEIPLTHGLGKVAIIDEADWPLVSQHKWRAHRDGRNWYALTNVKRPDGTWDTISMHRLILGMVNSRIHADYINGDGLDNRRANLRARTDIESGSKWV